MVALRIWRSSTALLLLGWLLVPSLLGAADDFLGAYKQGLKAIESRQWDLAAEKMREALAGRAEESRRLIKKGYRRRYLPHYFLGVAHFELDDCESALESWTESERQGVVTRHKNYYENLAHSREQCQARSRVTDQIAPLQRQLTKLSSKVSRASSLKRDPELQATWDTGSPSLAERQARAQEKLRQARTRLEQAQSQADLDLLPGVEDLLADAGREWRTFEQQAEAQRAKVRPTHIARKHENQEGNTLQQLDPSILGIDPPPAELDAAGRAFLHGDYPQVIEILEGFSAEDKRAMAHVHLLRSAALFALHRIRGDGVMLTLARGEARAARAADPELVLPERFFSARFRELFHPIEESDQED